MAIASPKPQISVHTSFSLPNSFNLIRLFSLFLCLYLPSTAPPEAESAGLDEEQYEEQNNGEEAGQDIQAVILVPGELMGLDPQVFGPLVSHGELDPEYGLIQRVQWSVMVDSRQPHDILLVTINVDTGELWIYA